MKKAKTISIDLLEFAKNSKNQEKQNIQAKIAKEELEKQKKEEEIKVQSSEYIENKYDIDKIDFQQLNTDLRAHLTDLVSQIIKKYKKVSLYKVDSKDSESIDPTMYRGSSGVLYGLYRYKILLNKETNNLQPNWLEFMLKESVKTTLFAGEDLKEEDVPSFYQSQTVGIATLAVLDCLEKFKIDRKSLDFLIYERIIAQNLRLCQKSKSLFEGAAGYLYSLLIIEKRLSEKAETYNPFDTKGKQQKFWCKNYQEIIQNTIREVVNQIDLQFKTQTENVSSMDMRTLNQKYSKNTTTTSFTKKTIPAHQYLLSFLATKTLGAKKGPVGFIYILLQSFEVCKDLKMDHTRLFESLGACIDGIIRLMGFLGRLPKSKPARSLNTNSDYKYLVNFENGSPGVLPLLGLAAEIYPERTAEIFDTLEYAGELTWKEGLLKKGNSLCHGITGNAYCLYSVYKAWKERARTCEEKLEKYCEQKAELWRKRALVFAQALIDQEIQQHIEAHDDKGRMKKGKSDYPYSLMEGISGQICFLSEVLNGNDDQIKFPGYEI